MERRGDFQWILPALPLWEPFTVIERLLVFFFYCNYATNLNVEGEHSFRTWNKSFFKPQFTIINLNIRNSTHPQLTTGKWRNGWRFVNIIAPWPMPGKTVFAQFTKAQSIHRGVYKWKMTMEKSWLRHWQLIQNFFPVSLPILVNVKPKTQSELCAPYSCAIGN